MYLSIIFFKVVHKISLFCPQTLESRRVETPGGESDLNGHDGGAADYHCAPWRGDATWAGRYAPTKCVSTPTLANKGIYIITGIPRVKHVIILVVTVAGGLVV